MRSAGDGRINGCREAMASVQAYGCRVREVSAVEGQRIRAEVPLPIWLIGLTFGGSC